MLWALLGCGGLVFVVILVVVISFVRFNMSERKKEERLEDEGRVVKAWIVFANDSLYKRNAKENFWPAQLVFTFKKNVENLDEVLEEIAEGIREFESEDDEDEAERIIGNIVRTEIGYYWPLRIPKRITGKLVAYTVAIDVQCKYLPNRKLTLPYVYVNAFVDEENNDGLARMVPYPDDDNDEDDEE